MRQDCVRRHSRLQGGEGFGARGEAFREFEQVGEGLLFLLGGARLEEDGSGCFGLHLAHARGDAGLSGVRAKRDDTLVWDRAFENGQRTPAEIGAGAEPGSNRNSGMWTAVQDVVSPGMDYLPTARHPGRSGGPRGGALRGFFTEAELYGCRAAGGLLRPGARSRRG